MSKKLKKGDISLNEMLELSRSVYQNKEVDNKAWRSRLDIQSAKITLRKNLVFNKQLNKWEQTGREVKIVFIIKSKPISYTDNSGIKIHKYPVTFLIRDIEMEMNSAFRCRVGSLRKPKFSIKKDKKISDGETKKEKQSIREDNKKITEKNKKIAKQNILNGIQLQFFFDSMWVYYSYGMLWGPNYAKWAPKKYPKEKWKERNPKLIPFFSKHEFFIVTKVLKPLLQTKKGVIKDRLFKNK